MATMKKGTRLGLTDSNFQQICVGDTLKNIHSGLLATINKYGNLICRLTGDKLELNSKDWIVCDLEEETKAAEERTDFDLDYKAGQEEAQAMKEIPDIVAAPSAHNEDAEQEAADTEEPLERQDVLRLYEDTDLLDELRRRGFSGTVTKKIITYQNVTI